MICAAVWALALAHVPVIASAKDAAASQGLAFAGNGRALIPCSMGLIAGVGTSWLRAHIALEKPLWSAEMLNNATP